MIFQKVEAKPIQYPQLRGSLAGMKYPAFAEIKVDGELNYLVYKGGHTTATINKYGNTRRDFKALNEITNILNTNPNVHSTVLICEIYWGDGKSGALYELLSHKKDNDVNICIFDILEYNQVNCKNEPLIDRRELLMSLGINKYIVDGSLVSSKQDAEEMFALRSGQGWEGIVVKDLDSRFHSGPCGWVKLKYKDRSDYPVTGIDSVKERIEIGCDYPNKPRVFVGIKAPNRYKKHIKIGDMARIEHQGVLPSGSLRHPVLIPKKGW
jgi:hypothetical protein